MEAQFALRCPCQSDGKIGRQADPGGAKIRLYGQFTSTAVDQNSQLDARRTTVIKKLIYHGTNRSPGVQNVIQDYDVSTVDLKRQFSLCARGKTAFGEIVPVH